MDCSVEMFRLEIAVRSLRWAVLVSSLATSGCFSLMGDAQAGYVSTISGKDGTQGVALQASGGMSIGDRSAETMGPGLAVRTKFTSEVQQVSVSPHVYLLPGSIYTPYARLGTNLFQFESAYGRFAYGMFSPYGELGLFLSPFVISGFVEYDLRFASVPNEAFFGIMAGLGVAGSTKTARAVVTGDK